MSPFGGGGGGGGSLLAYLAIATFGLYEIVLKLKHSIQNLGSCIACFTTASIVSQSLIDFSGLWAKCLQSTAHALFGRDRR